jgi:heptosyltransferase-1
LNIIEKFQKTPPKKILIVLLGAIGDVVRAFPLASQIKENWPDSEITWAVETASVGIVTECKFVTRAVEFKRKDGIFGFFRFIRELKKEKFDLTLDLQRHFKSGITSYLTGGSVRIGFNKQNSREANHLFNNFSINEVEYMSDKIEQYLYFSDYLGFKKKESRYDFGLEEDLDCSIDLEDKLKKILTDKNLEFYPKDKRALLFIGSTWESKIWPSINFYNLAKDLFANFGYLPILVGSKGDLQKAKEIIALGNSPLINFVGETSLKEFKNLCFNAKFAVACDSGPMHIACAVGLPVISLWGPTSPIRSKPYSNSKFIIQSPIGCRECYQRKCPGLDGICLSDIGPEVVLAMSKPLLV